MVGKTGQIREFLIFHNLLEIVGFFTFYYYSFLFKALSLNYFKGLLRAGKELFYVGSF